MELLGRRLKQMVDGDAAPELFEITLKVLKQEKRRLQEMESML